MTADGTSKPARLRHREDPGDGRCCGARRCDDQLPARSDTRLREPEQVSGETVTTASDVYSLGIILYELLDGREALPRRPAPRETAIEPCLDPALRKPEHRRAPSTGVPRLDSPRSCAVRLRGDLDNIVLMALRREPERRYGTVERLAERHSQTSRASADHGTETDAWVSGRDLRRPAQAGNSHDGAGRQRSARRHRHDVAGSARRRGATGPGRPPFQRRTSACRHADLRGS